MGDVNLIDKDIYDNEVLRAANQAAQDGADGKVVSGERTTLNGCPMVDLRDDYQACVDADYCTIACGFVTIVTDETANDCNHGVNLNRFKSFFKSVTPKFRNELAKENIKYAGSQNKLVLD